MTSWLHLRTNTIGLDMMMIHSFYICLSCPNGMCAAVSVTHVAEALLQWRVCRTLCFLSDRPTSSFAQQQACLNLSGTTAPPSSSMLLHHQTAMFRSPIFTSHLYRQCNVCLAAFNMHDPAITLQRQQHCESVLGCCVKFPELAPIQPVT